ncbi:MAG: (2Fe-2S)-binding protein [Pseudomonadota bacterium]
MKQIIELSVNGESYELAVEPQATLLEVLRNHLSLTGTKESCGTGECGSCTVLIDRRAVLSCLTLAVDCPGHDIITIEGLAHGERLSIVQQAFHDCGAIQCGFCTPGMVLSVTALLEEVPSPTGEEIKKALEGHLCRCTGYNKIIEAVKRAAAQMLAEGEQKRDQYGR